MKWLPESPRYLMMKGREDETRQVLGRLHQKEEASIEFRQIEAQIKMDNALPHSWSSLITKKSYRIRTFYALGLACGIQFTGVLVINSMSNGPSVLQRKMHHGHGNLLTKKLDYSAIIYSGLGFSGSTILIYAAGYNTLAFGCGFIAIWIIDLFPRNRLVSFGTAIVTSCLTVEAALVANFPTGPGQNNDALRAAAAMTFLYVVSCPRKPP